jgi:hypothetical protein
MLKITIIIWIIFIVTWIIFKLINLTDEEKIIYLVKKELPMRLIILTLILGLEFITGIILTIITIILW